MLLGDPNHLAGPLPYAHLMAAARDSIREVLATNVRALMKRRGWNQEQLGKKAGISQTHVGNILRRQVSPTGTMISGLAKAFNMPEWVLLAPAPVEVLDSPELPRLLETYLEAAKKPLATVIAERAARQQTA